MTEEIVAPLITDGTTIDSESDLQRLDMIWKYQTTIGFAKSILRKYSDEFEVLVEKLNAGLDSAVSHEPTKAVLKSWINEISKL